MKRLFSTLASSLLLLTLFARDVRAGRSLHPPVVLRDAGGRSVLESGLPVSPARTCGECHDTTYIQGHSYHAAVGSDETFPPGTRDAATPWSFSPGLFGRWDPRHYGRLTAPGEAAFDLGVADWIRRYGARHVGGGPAFFARDGTPLAARRPGPTVDPETHVTGPTAGSVHPWDWRRSGAVEMNCFLCHVAKPANDARIRALSSGAFAWAATATLEGVGVAEPDPSGGWRYVREAFSPSGEVLPGRMAIQDPRSANCGLCHGVVDDGREPLDLARHEGWETDGTGLVFSPELVSASASNVHGKENLDFPFDVHAARLLGCTDCHHSLNNPAAFIEAERSRPRHLTYDARRLEIGDYLTRPSHHFTKGESAQGNVARRLDDSMRRCEDCHDAEDVHAAWLPNPKRHLDTLLCETCHLPEVEAPALEQIDWTVLSPEREPGVVYRGADGPVGDPTTLVTGYEPVILPRRQSNGSVRHGPHNLVTSWFWVGGDPERPVREATLAAALFGGEGVYAPEVLAALDTDRDGSLAPSELRLDTQAKVEAVRRRLESLGVSHPRILGSIQPLSLHHGMRPGRASTRRCQTCHATDSRMTRPFELSPYVPAGATATLVPDTNVLWGGRLYVAVDGRLAYEPVPTASGRYVLGHDRAGWIDTVGIVLVLATAFGVLGHAVLRAGHARRRRKETLP